MANKSQILIKRAIYQTLEDHLSSKAITVIIGPRQVGKTTLAKKLQAFLKDQGRPTLFFNLDIEDDQRYFTSQEVLLQKIRLEAGSEHVTVFIDELQRKKNAGLFLKGLFDQALPIKFVVTGSGSLELRANVSESLAGRKRVFEIHPVSFIEYFHYRTNYRYEQKEKAYFELEGTGAGFGLLQEYLSFGGYPNVILAETIEEKKLTIAELFTAYLDKDIRGLLNIQHDAAFVLLFRLIADRAGKPVNFSGLANEVNLSVATLVKYLHYAEETYIVKRLNPFFNNIGKELTKSPQYYFNDIGLRNYSAAQFDLLHSHHPAYGFIFQHYVFQQLELLCKKEGWILNFWRSRDHAEVDFVINRINDIVPIEVKFKSLKSPQLTASIHSFINKYQPAKVIVINLSLHQTLIVEGTELVFLPWWYLLLPDWNVGNVLHV